MTLEPFSSKSLFNFSMLSSSFPFVQFLSISWNFFQNVYFVSWCLFVQITCQSLDLLAWSSFLIFLWFTPVMLSRVQIFFTNQQIYLLMFSNCEHFYTWSRIDNWKFLITKDHIFLACLNDQRNEFLFSIVWICFRQNNIFVGIDVLSVKYTIHLNGFN